MAYVKKTDRVAKAPIETGLSAVSNKQLVSHVRKMKRELAKKFVKDVSMLDNSIKTLKALSRK